MTEIGSAEVVIIPSSAAGELSDPMQVYCPACEVIDGAKERIVTAIVSFLLVSVATILSFRSFPETVPDTVVH